MKTNTPMELWHQAIQEKKTDNLTLILADDVVLHSPVVHTPIVGKKIVTMYLMAAFHTLVNQSFQYLRELHSESDAILEFTTEVDGIVINGVDMIKWNEDGKIIDFKVMVRPLKAVNMLHQKMGMLLEMQKNVKS